MGSSLAVVFWCCSVLWESLAEKQCAEGVGPVPGIEVDRKEVVLVTFLLFRGRRYYGQRRGIGDILPIQCGWFGGSSSSSFSDLYGLVLQCWPADGMEMFVGVVHSIRDIGFSMVYC